MLTPVGFWSYARHDDAHSDGHLSQLRVVVGKAIGLRYGGDVKLWQDVIAIDYGVDWGNEIARTLRQTTFFVPIVTPRFLKSKHCHEEYLTFRERMRALHRDDLVFPIHYVDIDDVEPEDTRFGPDLIRLRDHQWADFRQFLDTDPRSSEVRAWAGGFAKGILKMMRRRVGTELPGAARAQETEHVAAEKHAKRAIERLASGTKGRELAGHRAAEPKVYAELSRAEKAYLHGYAFDVFFSYAHGPQVGSKALQRWTLTFHDHLLDLINTYLQQKDRGAEVRSWIERGSRATPVDEGMAQIVQRSALFICIMSPYYLNSSYCNMEIKYFKDDLADEDTKKGRIFVVNISETARERWPKSLRYVNGSAIPGYDFYDNEYRMFFGPFGYPEPQLTHVSYARELRKLAVDIVDEVLSIKLKEYASRTIFLGVVHDTLVDVRSKIRAWLEKSGAKVLPHPADDPFDQTSLDAALSTLPECDLAMLVVNQYCGAWPNGALAGFVSYQVDAFRAARKPYSVWVTVGDSVPVQNARYKAFLSLLLEDRGARHSDVEEFCRSVL